eukprot:1065826-Amorphochlora_amoeboformis.AAC.3
MDLDLEGFAFVSIAGALGASAAYTIGRTWNTKVKLVAVAGGAAIGGVWYYLNNNTNQREHDEKDFHELETLEKLVPVEQAVSIPADHLDNTLHWVRNETQLRHTSWCGTFTGPECDLMLVYGDSEKLMELFNAKDNIIKKEDFVSKFKSSQKRYSRLLTGEKTSRFVTWFLLIFITQQRRWRGEQKGAANRAVSSHGGQWVQQEALHTYTLSLIDVVYRQRKLEMAWSLFDMDNDGHISMEEMVTYFTSYFKVMAELDPNFSKKFKYTAGNLVPIEEIAKHTGR